LGKLRNFLPFTPQKIGHSQEFLRNIFQDAEKNSFLLKKLGTQQILMLKKIQEKKFPGCSKNLA
jgi:hypothetical protein